MPNLPKLLWYFYKPICIWNMAFTAAAIALVAVYSLKVAAFVLFFKLMGYASTIFLRSYTAKNVYMFYRNAGYSIARMYTYVFLIDLSVYMLLLVALILLTR